MEEQRKDTRREGTRRETAPDVERHLGSVLPDAQVRGDDRRQGDRRGGDRDPGDAEAE